MLHSIQDLPFFLAQIVYVLSQQSSTRQFIRYVVPIPVFDCFFFAWQSLNNNWCIKIFHQKKKLQWWCLCMHQHLSTHRIVWPTVLVLTDNQTWMLLVSSVSKLEVWTWILLSFAAYYYLQQDYVTRKLKIIDLWCILIM